MRLSSPRVAPLADSEWNDEAEEVLGRLRRGDGRVLNIFRTLGHHPKLLKRWMVFGNHVLSKSSLSPRDREIAILRIGWLCQAEYEWGQHADISRQIGMTEAEITRVSAGPGAEGWTPLESALIRAVDELHADAMISNETWEALSAHYETQQLMDLVFTVGQYNLVSMALNTLGVQLDEGVAGFPK